MKMDRALVAAIEDAEREVKYIASHYKIPIAVVRGVIHTLMAEGKGYRSRKIIYNRLRAQGYKIDLKK